MTKPIEMMAPGTVAPADGNYSHEDLHSFALAARAGQAGEAQRDDGREIPGNDEPSSHAGAGLNIGQNNELLDDARPHLVNALRELVRQYREEGIVARRHEIRRIHQARLFWQGLHYAWWNPNDMNWHLPYENRASDDRALEEMPRYQFVTNFYQGFGLSFIAVLSQDVPSVRFYPQSSQSLEDIAAAGGYVVHYAFLSAAGSPCGIGPSNEVIAPVDPETGLFSFTNTFMGITTATNSLGRTPSPRS